MGTRTLRALGCVLRVAAAAVLIGEPLTLRGGTLTWTAHGPAGGNVYCIVPDPFRTLTAYAGTDHGVYRTDDAGIRWRAVNVGLPAARVQTIAIDPSNPSTLYAGTLTPNGVPSLGVFKSTDAGATWTAINNGLIDPATGVAPLDVGALAVDPMHPGTLLAGARFSDLFLSTDAGATWQPVTLGGYNIALQTSAFVYDPADPSQVYAATTAGLLLSTDGGQSWAPYGDAGIPLFTLAFDPGSSSTVYSGDVNGFGILKSMDGGAHWIDANVGLPATTSSAGTTYPKIYALAADPTAASTLYAGTDAGLFASTDGAATWTAVDTGMRVSTLTSLAFAPGHTASLYAGTLGGGAYLRPDGAAGWTWRSDGLDLSLVSAVVADTAPSGTVFAATYDGIHASSDGGSSWRRADSGLPAYPAAALTPGAGNLFVGTLGGGLLESSDGGSSWSPLSPGSNEAFISAVAVDPASASTLFAGTGHDTTTAQHLYKSTDGGGSWSQTSLAAGTSPINAIVVDSADSQHVAALSRGGSTYSESRNGGGTWSAVTVAATCGTVNTILFASTGMGTYVGGTAGVCRSDDGGKTWTLSAVAGSASVRALLAASDPSILYAGVQPATSGGVGGVYQSFDGGQTWAALGSGLETAAVTSLAIGPSQALLAGLSGGGVATLGPLIQGRGPVQPPAPGGRSTRELVPR